VFEGQSVAVGGVPSVVDVDLVATVVIPCIANVETTGCVWHPRLRFERTRCASTLHPSGANGLRL
jgi:hypothetical protein